MLAVSFCRGYTACVAKTRRQYQVAPPQRRHKLPQCINRPPPGASCPLATLQVRAAELLRRADVVIYDDLGAAEALEQYVPPAAEQLYVGKRGGRPSIKQPEIDALLVAAAAGGRTVVRLKGGCPSVFSRVSRAAPSSGCWLLRFCCWLLRVQSVAQVSAGFICVVPCCCVSARRSAAPYLQ